MFCIKIFLLSYILHECYCDWVSEWMSPVQSQLQKNTPKVNDDDLLSFDEPEPKMVQVTQESAEESHKSPAVVYPPKDAISTNKLKIKLENTLKSAEQLIETLRDQINALAKRENLLKEAIASGRSGVSTLTVSMMDQVPRTYIIRDGDWFLCNGMVQYPVPGNTQPTNDFTELFSSPRCIGQEVSSSQDPCVFNSMIKYETLPTRRRLEYTEEDYLCLKPAFNNTLEQYLSVPKRVINQTCTSGVIRSLKENTRMCGVRVMSEYTYYPPKSSAAAELPLEYCVEKDSACKMIVAWHVSNVSIENFEFLKNENSFKKYFMTAYDIEQII